MAMDAVPFDLLRSSLDELKLRFQAANDPGSPSKAWLVHVHDKGDEKSAIYAMADGYDSPSVKSSPSTWGHLGVPAIGRRVPRFRRAVRLNGYERLTPICTDAGRLLDKLPAAVQKRLWRGLPAGTDPRKADLLSYWVLAVFELANPNVFGFPLQADRMIPLGDEQVKTIFAPESRLPADADWYATLPDFAAASVQAVAIIQSWLPDVPKRKTETAADDKSEARIVAAIADLLEKPKRATRKAKRPAHRPPDTDAKSDAKIADTWLQKRNSGECRAYSDLAGVLKRDVAEVKEAIDRDRKRRPEVWAANKRKPRRKKSVKSE